MAFDRDCVAVRMAIFLSQERASTILVEKGRGAPTGLHYSKCNNDNQFRVPMGCFLPLNERLQAFYFVLLLYFIGFFRCLRLRDVSLV
mmetsp:Transcript_17123/g.47079  ORF Transcript_17123/g.47079 Transcript_17123/m.47079 type:complete len:88 (+) Transcript_17123:91-354(+)